MKCIIQYFELWVVDEISHHRTAGYDLNINSDNSDKNVSLEVLQSVKTFGHKLR